jgi:hypothetical protein
MSSLMQTWLELGVVAIAAAWLAWRWWTRRHHHEGCDCPGAGGGELAKLKRKIGRRR